MPEQKKISVSAVVYNEEARIEDFLRGVSWSDDVIIVDKSSTDRTWEIAERYGARVIKVPYSDTGDEGKFAYQASKNEWQLCLTASEMIHPKLVDELHKLINDPNFDYDVIYCPFSVGVFGIRDRHSPWNFPLKPRMAKAAVLRAEKTVHKELQFATGKFYYMKRSDEIALYHLTHQSLDSFFERHIRYTKAEATLFKSKTWGLLKILGEICAAIGWMLVYKRVWRLGWNGVALGLAFLSYFIMKFLYTWERFEGKGEEKYKALRKQIIQEWESRGHGRKIPDGKEANGAESGR